MDTPDQWDMSALEKHRVQSFYCYDDDYDDHYDYDDDDIASVVIL